MKYDTLIILPYFFCYTLRIKYTNLEIFSMVFPLTSGDWKAPKSLHFKFLIFNFASCRNFTSKKCQSG